MHPPHLARFVSELLGRYAKLFDGAYSAKLHHQARWPRRGLRDRYLCGPRRVRAIRRRRVRVRATRLAPLAGAPLDRRRFAPFRQRWLFGPRPPRAAGPRVGGGSAARSGGEATASLPGAAMGRVWLKGELRRRVVARPEVRQGAAGAGARAPGQALRRAAIRNEVDGRPRPSVNLSRSCRLNAHVWTLVAGRTLGDAGPRAATLLPALLVQC